jgi:pimeloyl-ACP methyl ester carboxylesterase
VLFFCLRFGGGPDPYYGAGDKAKTLLTSICDAFPGRQVYFFAYDWRKGNAGSADKLIEFITQDLGVSKVDIVAHSMGGIVTASLYGKAPHLVDHVITIATPYEGSAEAIMRQYPTPG